MPTSSGLRGRGDGHDGPAAAARAPSRPPVRSFITGIAGFAGSHLAERLLARGDAVAGLVLDAAAPRPSLAPVAARGPIEIHAGDIADVDRLTAVLAAVRPERIFHLAGLAAPGRSFADPLAFYRVNALGTAALLEAVERAGLRDTTRVLLASSGEVYGRAAGRGPIPEDTPLRPVSPYGASKAAAEAIAIAACLGRGIEVVIARAFNHTGARQEPDFAGPAFARQIALAEAGRAPPEIRAGRLDAVRDFSHVEEVVTAYAALLERGRAGEAYNIGTGRGVRIADLLGALVAQARIPIQVVDDPARHRPVEIPSLIADTRRLAATIGFGPRRPLEEVTSDLLADWRRRVGGDASPHARGSTAAAPGPGPGGQG